MPNDMDDPKPFDPNDAYDFAVEMIRVAALDGMSKVAMPAGIPNEQAVIALPHGASMAFVCIVLATAKPGQSRDLLREISKQLPEMMRMAETIRQPSNA